MKNTLKHITGIMLLLLVFSSCNREENIIPRKKMSKIYAEMLMTDQWLQLYPDVRKLADTTLIYEPILEKYGYTSEDYRRTVYKYLDDPERFARIFRNVADTYEKRIAELERLREEIKIAEERAERLDDIVVNFNLSDYFPYMFDEPYVHYPDSISVEMDTLTNSLRFKHIELADTTYDGLVMIIRTDSLAIRDSLAAADSLAVADSLAAADSIKLKAADVTEDKLLKHLKSEKDNIFTPMKMPLAIDKKN